MLLGAPLGHVLGDMRLDTLQGRRVKAQILGGRIEVVALSEDRYPENSV